MNCSNVLCIKTMSHLNEVGTYYIKLISSLINIKRLVLTQQVKLAHHMALSPSSSPPWMLN